jgi:hypothetical protein
MSGVFADQEQKCAELEAAIDHLRNWRHVRGEGADLPLG